MYGFNTSYRTYFPKNRLQVTAVTADALTKQVYINSGTCLKTIQSKKQRAAFQQKMAFIRTGRYAEQKIVRASTGPAVSYTPSPLPVTDLAVVPLWIFPYSLS